MNIEPSITATTVRWRVHILAGLVLSAIALSVYAALDFGNQIGVDEWWRITAASLNVVGYTDSLWAYRSLAFMPSVITFGLVGPNPIRVQALYLAIQVISAFILYLLVLQMTPQKPIFALVCGVGLIVYTYYDWYRVLTYGGVTLSIVSLIYLASLLFFQLHWRRNQPLLFIVGLGLLILGLLVYEAGLPLMLGVPILIFILDRHLQKYRIVSLLIWLIIGIVASLPTILPILGKGESNYSTNLMQSPTLDSAMQALQVQLANLFLEPAPFLIRFATFYRFRLPILLVVLVTSFGTTIFLHETRKLAPAHSEEGTSWGKPLLGMIIGFVLIMLGYAAYFPTALATNPRALFLSLPGVSIIIASGLWLLSRAAPRKNGDSTWLVGLSLLCIYGVTQFSTIQSDLYSFDLTWDYQAYFLRSLANQVGEVKDNTLFILIETPDTNEAPFTAGWGFQYALLYLYSYKAQGIIPADSLVSHTWTVTDSGWHLTPRPEMQNRLMFRSFTYGWDEVVFIAKRRDGSVDILDTIPAEFYTPQRAAQYDPDSRFTQGFVPARIYQLIPPIRNPNTLPED